MIGFNGGLIGKARDTATSPSVPGVWTLVEQLKAKRAGLWPPTAGEDPYFSSVSLLLRGDGSNGSTTIIDGSLTPKTVTAFGNAQISTAQSKYGGSSIYFDGTGDYLQTSTSSDLALGAGDFTEEFWMRPSTFSSGFQTFFNHWGGSGSGFYLWLEPVSGGYAIDIVQDANTYIYNSSANIISANVWSHVAICRSSGTIRLFVNGTQSYSFANSTSFTSNAVWIASNAGNASGSNFNGYIDDLRITKGVARYTSNFTPPGAL